MLIFLLVQIACSIIFEKIPKANNPPDKFYIPGLVLDPVLSRIIYFGMKNAQKNIFENTLYTFDLISLSWDKITPESEFIPSPLGSPFLYLRSDRILFSFFGYNDHGYISDVYAYNLTSNMWSTLELFHVPGRSYFSGSSFVHDDKELIAFFGGYTKNGVSNELYLFDVWNMEFTLMPNNGYQVNPSASQSIAYLDRKLYMIGIDGENALDSKLMFNYAFKIYDLDSQTWTLNYTSKTNKNILLLGHNLITFNETLYIIGGYYSTTGHLNNEIFEVNLTDFSTYSLVRESNPAYFRAYTTIVKYNNSLIISGGRSGSQTNNEIFQVFISPYSLKILSKESFSPQNRKNSVMVTYSSYFYMFGGSTADYYLNDMWRFSVNESKWEVVLSIGQIPSPREKFYIMHYFDLGFLIFGGKANDFYSDIYFFTFSSNFWSKPEYSGDLPGPRHSGCTTLWDDNIIIIGGYNEAGITDEIWILNPLTFVSYKVNWIGSISLKLMDHVCRSLDVIEGSIRVYIFGGKSAELVESYYSYIIKLWSEDGIYYSTNLETIHRLDFSMQVSESKSIYYEDTTIIFFGSSWGLYFSNSIIKINHSTNTHQIIKFPFYISGHSLVHYNTSIYIFGGCFSKNILFFKNCFSNALYKLDFEESDNLKLPCSHGMISPNCEFCLIGTYMNNEKMCIPCGPGKYSKTIGATSTLSCIPCEYGTFNEDDISSNCKYCPGSSICYIGSSQPKYNFIDNVDSNIQPKGFLRDYKDISNYTMYSAIGISSLFILLFLGLHQFRSLLPKVDLFTSQHSNDLNKPIIYRTTSIGGLFSLFFLAFCLATLPPMIDSYLNDNIYEQKALVPLVTLDKIISSSFLIVTIELHYYGGICAQSGDCISLISITENNFKYKKRSIFCAKLSNTCSIQITYSDCQIIDLASISIVSYEYESYCSILSVNITSYSSIPGEISSVGLNLKPESNNKVFKGSTPSEFNFELIPSVFYSESEKWPSELTGYHVSKYGTSKIGTNVEQKYIIINPLLNVKVNLLRSNSALVTERKLIYTWMMFSSAVLGSVFGAMGAFGFFMANSESLLELADKKNQSCIKVEKLKSDRKVLEVNFKEVIKINPDKEILDFSFENPGKGSQTIYFD